jgi:hypothetical protein
MEKQYPTYYTYHTLSCSDNSVTLEINEWASVVHPDTHYTINFYAYKTSLRWCYINTTTSMSSIHTYRATLKWKFLCKIWGSHFNQSINLSITVFWDVMPCCLVGRNQYIADLFLLHCDRGCRFLWYIATYLINYKASSPRRLCICSMPSSRYLKNNSIWGYLFLLKNWNNLVMLHLVPIDTVTVILLTHWGRVTQICVFTLQLCKMGDANLRFYHALVFPAQYT